MRKYTVEVDFLVCQRHEEEITVEAENLTQAIAQIKEKIQDLYIEYNVLEDDDTWANIDWESLRLTRVADDLPVEELEQEVDQEIQNPEILQLLPHGLDTDGTDFVGR